MAGSIELGDEPPIWVDGSRGGLIDRRRWFSATILTGLCGAALMGGAVFASLNGQTNFAAAQKRVETALRGALTSLGDHLTGGLHKTDRLSSFGASNVEREVLRVPNVSHSQDRETVRVRPYERVFGNLSLTASGLSANIPPFNPQKILDEEVSGDDHAAVPLPEPEVSLSTCQFVPPPQHGTGDQAVCELSSLLPMVKRSSQLPLDDVMEQVRDAAKEAGIGAPQLINPDKSGNAGSLPLGYASEDPYVGFAARIFPMNVTLLPKTQPDASNDSNERIIAAKKDDTVGSILRDLGAAPDQIQQILVVLGPAASGALKEGQRVRVLLAPAGLGRVVPERVIVEGDSTIEAAAALSDMNTYVPVDIRNVDSDSTDQGVSAGAGESEGGVTLYQSLYETALRNNVPRAVIDEMVRIYAYDVDFRRKVEPGDSFDVLYAEDTSGNGTHEVRYTSLTVGGETKRFYHFRTADDGQYDYYDATGKSEKKFLVRKPVAVGVETSPFGWRIHPVLFFKEFHTGVDWAAPLGTPIFAAGDGTIEQIGEKSGYGKYVRIRHADGYETAYSHLTAYASGLDVGSRVRQGQVIGFVGSTGISTGPHVLFEILLNGHFVDPMRVELPRGRVLDGGTLARFEQDRHQLDALIGRRSRKG
ncbi:MAG TPA: M23 family metallopeptidase [Xanthobacteraceae bacterium]|nr:M23 family metallopeptidase [Xanthobacteraceae bacterium]